MRSRCGSLRNKVEADADAGAASRLAQVEARERVVIEMEKNVREIRARADTEYKRLQNMMATLEVAQNRFGAGQDEDRVRLREEHARLEAMQVSLETERTMVRQELSKDRDALRADRAAFEAERRAWRTQCATEKSTFEGRKTQLDAIEASHHEWELQLRRDGEDLKRRMRAFEEQRSSSMKQMEEVELNVRKPQLEA